MENIGYILYDVHTFVFVAFVFIFIMRPTIRPVMILLYLPFFIAHALGMGCPMTKIEKYYHKQDATIIDPLLYIFGFEITNQNRYRFQAFFSACLLLFMLGNLHY